MNNNAIEEREREREREGGENRRGGGGASVGAGQGEQAPERVETAFWELGRVLEVEPLVGTELERRRARRSDTGDVRLTTRDIATLTWVGEQYAAFLPQLGRLLACSRGAAYHTRSRWIRAGWATGRAIRADQPPLVWLTAEGLRMCELEFPTWRPSAAMLAHVQAVNEVRLWVAEVRPDWGWTCERELARRQERTAAGVRIGHRPDALVETDAGQTIPIEVERTQKKAARMEAIMREAVKAHGQVWYFAPPGPARALERVADQLGLAGKVKVDPLPGDAVPAR